MLEQKTTIEETVRESFTHNLEALRGGIAKENITHQIFTNEYAQRRFERLDILSVELRTLNKHANAFITVITIQEDYHLQQIGKPFIEAHDKATDALYSAAMYIDDSLYLQANDFLKKCFDTMIQAVESYTTMKQFQHDIKSGDEVIRKDSTEKFNTAYFTLQILIGDLPHLLEQLQKEFRKYLINFSPEPLPMNINS